MKKNGYEEVRKRLEKKEQFKDMDLSFHDGRKISYSFEIISYQGNEPEETNIIKYETGLFICQNVSENK